MISALGVVSAVGATTIGFAAPASADTASFLDIVAPKYVFLSESQLLSAGDQACAAARSGVSGSDNTLALSNSLGISIAAAAEIVRESIINLGC